MGTTSVSESLKLSPQNRPQQTSIGSIDEEREENSVTSSGHSPRPEDLGNTRGKRMAMKFVNKIASKEKYTQVQYNSSFKILKSLCLCRQTTYKGKVATCNRVTMNAPRICLWNRLANWRSKVIVQFVIS